MENYDVIIIGAGPGGMTSALYASRANLSVVMIDRGIYGGQMNNTAEIENYPGFKSILGPDLAKEMYGGATNFGAKYQYGTVESIEDHSDHKVVHTDNGDFSGKVVIIATGSQYKKLGVEGEDEYGGRGVSYCAVCDGAFFKNRHVIVVGGGDSAIQESLYLAQIVNKVTVVHRRGELRAQKVLQDQAFANDKIDFVWNTNVTAIQGDKMKVIGVDTVNNETNETGHLDADGVFIYVGNNPMTKPFQDLGITDAKGWIETNDEMATKLPGIFAIGDVRKKQLRQIVTAVGDGGIAGQNAFEYIQNQN